MSSKEDGTQELNDAQMDRPGWSSLSPVRQFLRAVEVFADRVAVTFEDKRIMYREFGASVEKLAGFLRSSGVQDGDRVALILENTPFALEVLYAVAGIGAVSVPINFRLASREISHILNDCDPRVVFVESELLDIVSVAYEESRRDVLILSPDSNDYREAIQSAVPVALEPPQDEMSLLSINYTSGTTGTPKGVMYTHRGAYLHSLGVIAGCGLSHRTRYLWTLPMFHCHGWAFTWAITATGGEHVCLRRPDPKEAWRLLTEKAITHFCGAPTVLLSLVNHPDASFQSVSVFTGGAAPTPTLLSRCEELGWSVTHMYGLTETYGPQIISEWFPEWDDLPRETRARLKARQGVASVVSTPVRVVDAQGNDVPRDGQTVGEILLTGNNVTIGYYRDPHGSEVAFSGGWFHSGDLGVHHADGVIELTDRKKDIIITGGENVSTIELESVITQHEAVQEVAVVGVPDDYWGEHPHVFVVLRPSATLTLTDLQAFMRDRVTSYKLPRGLTVCDDLPRTATGKIQKFLLKQMVK